LQGVGVEKAGGGTPTVFLVGFWRFLGVLGRFLLDCGWEDVGFAG
jgi:hypothetical protein